MKIWSFVIRLGWFLHLKITSHSMFESINIHTLAELPFIYHLVLAKYVVIVVLTSWSLTLRCKEYEVW